MGKNKTLLLSPKAYEDLELIYEHTLSKWGFKQAEKYIDLIYGAMREIERYPNIGVVYKTPLFTYRKLVVGNHILYYRLENDNLFVIRVLHSRMDQNSRF